ncbi:pancreatic lipase-related protein 2-like [Thrips palmi]|uniref:Pancreatic lipase-related protein 2-like n=1 Tax=Thrips palmi TaxID=161013 RepID=A0A6P8Z5L6_THRPL|nr:pancreatic lipase-related protein 2-like [Thrips palmi]
MRAFMGLAVLLLCVAATLGRVWPWTPDVPDKEAEKKVKFELYTRDNPEEPEMATVSELPETLKYFNNALPTKILVHGWHGSKKHTIELKNAYLSVADMNVFLINWHEVDTLYYPGAAARVKSVARQQGAFITYLVQQLGLRGEDLHIVGHSLGAHIAGLSSLHIEGDFTIGRITGLDPAGPLFKDGRENRLDKSHAAFVDIIHTCGNVFGYHDPIGHADFYPNGGGAFQPGCLLADITTGKCSHNRAYSLFGESINNEDAFLARPSLLDTKDSSFCSRVDTDADKVPMGAFVPESARGVFCLATRAEAPFGYGDEDVDVVTNWASSLQAKLMKLAFWRRRHD